MLALWALTKSAVVTEESSYAAHAERTMQSNINPLSLKKPLALRTASEPPPAVKTKSKQKHRMKRSPKMKNCHMLLNKAQSALPGLIAVARHFYVPGQPGFTREGHDGSHGSEIFIIC